MITGLKGWIILPEAPGGSRLTFLFPTTGQRKTAAYVWTYMCVCCVCMQAESVVIRHPRRHRSLWEQQETCRGQKTAWKERRKKSGRSGRVAFDLLSKPCICNTFVILHLLTKRCLQDDDQSADTNPADFKLPFTIIRKRVRNLNHERLRSILKPVLFCFCFFRQPASLKRRWMLNGWFISTVTTHTLIYKTFKSLLTHSDVLAVHTNRCR